MFLEHDLIFGSGPFMLHAKSHITISLMYNKEREMNGGRALVVVNDFVLVND